MTEKVLSIFNEGRVTEDALGMISSAFMEVIHVELSDKRVHFGVPEVTGKDNRLKFVDVFDDELSSRGSPVNYLGKLLILNNLMCTFKI